MQEDILSKTCPRISSKCQLFRDRTGLHIQRSAMTFSQAVSTCIRNYATFRGKASRSEYWYFVLFTILFFTVAAVISNVAKFPYILIAPSLLCLIPGLAVASRRLQDGGFSPLFLFLYIVPFGQIALLVMYCMPTKTEELRSRQSVRGAQLFCHHCGSPLIAKATSCRSCGEPVG